jgi:hypothetical protein
MADQKPVTKEEALRYDKSALEADIARKRKSAQMLKEEISKIESEINRLIQIIAIIDANKT